MFLSRFSTNIGIDLGTCNTIICINDKIVINEPSVVAVEKGTKRVVAVGGDAKRMLCRVPGNIEAIRPLREGVIADMDTTEKMIRYFILKVLPRYRFIKPRMVIGIPSCITGVETKAVHDIAMKAGAGYVKVIEESLVAAIGANIPIGAPEGNMVCDIGGGTTEVSVISLGGMVKTKAIRVGGDKFDQAIIDHVLTVDNLKIGEQTAEEVKINIGNALNDKNIEKTIIKGTDSIKGLPRKLEIDSIEVREALKKPISQIVDIIKKTLAETPEQLASDIVERGIVMTGGGALLKGLPKLISQETRVPVIVAENPMNCVAIGAGKYYKVFDEINSSRSIYNSINK